MMYIKNNAISLLPNILIFLLILITVKLFANFTKIAYIEWVIYAISPIIIFYLLAILKTKIKYNQISIVLLIFVLYLPINTLYKTEDVIISIQALVMTSSYFFLYTVFINYNFKEYNFFPFYFVILLMLMLISFDSSISVKRIDGLLGNPNLTAHFSILLLPMILYFQRNNKLLQIFSLFIVYIIVIKTGSRSTLLALILLSNVFFLYKTKILKTTFNQNILIIIITLLITIFIIDVAQYFIQSSFISNLIGNSRFSYLGDNHRFIIWNYALEAWSNNIFTGVGTGYKFYDITSHNHILGFHNTFLNILTTAGILGLILFLYLIKLFIAKNSNNFDISQYKMLQLVVFISLSYNATIFFAISFHYYIFLLFQTFQTKLNNSEKSNV